MKIFNYSLDALWNTLIDILPNTELDKMMLTIDNENLSVEVKCLKLLGETTLYLKKEICCKTCDHAEPPICYSVAGENFGHPTEVTSDFYCENWIRDDAH